MKKDTLIAILFLLLAAVILVAGFWWWWQAPCEWIKAINGQVPGRCI